MNNLLTSNYGFIFANWRWKWFSCWERLTGVSVGWINDTQVAFHILKNPEKSTTMWEKRWLTTNPSTEMNNNIVRTVIDDDRHLSTRALEVFLLILWIIIHCIFIEKLVMVDIASTCVPHTLTSNQMWIRVETTLKFLGLIAEDSNYLNRVVTYDESRVHHYDPLTKLETEHRKRSSSRSRQARNC